MGEALLEQKWVHIQGQVDFPGGSEGKQFICNVEDPVPGSGRSPGEGNGYPLQSSCLENPMDRGTWGATVHGVTKSQIQLSTHTHSQPALESGAQMQYLLYLWKNFIQSFCQSFNCAKKKKKKKERKKKSTQITQQQQINIIQKGAKDLNRHSAHDQ